MIIGIVLVATLVSVLILHLLQRRLELTPFQMTLLNILVACSIVWGLQQWMLPPPAETPPTVIKSGESFRAQISEQELVQPLLTEVDVYQPDVVAPEHKDIVVDTPLVRAYFDEHGAVLHTLLYKKSSDSSDEELIPLWKNGASPTERSTNEQPGAGRSGAGQPEVEQTGFLVAFRTQTPLKYKLLSRTSVGTDERLLFQAQGPDCIVEKEFVLHSDTNKIDLKLHIRDVTAPVQPRIFFPTPFLGQSLSYDVMHGVVYTHREKIEKFTTLQAEGKLWVRPALFGAEDRYFVAALVHDAQSFVERAYYRVQGLKQMVSILEGPVIENERTWQLSFYCGPKQTENMAAVDVRLTALIDYGWLSPISRTLFALLQYIHTFVKNYGWAIIILTLLLKLLMLPFSLRADATPKKMMDLQKKMQAIERKYKDDRARRDQEVAELVRKHGLGDMLGFGCLQKVLLQGVVFIGLNRVLSVAFEMYRAPFISGWISNLAAADPYYILPLLTGVGIFLQMRNVSDPRQFVTAIMMTLIIIGIMVNLSAGVVLFSCVSAWLDFLQSSLQKKYAS